MNPLELLIHERESIKQTYIMVLNVNFPSRTSKNGINIFRREKEFELMKINDLIKQYEVTIETLKALNQYEYLGENS